MLSLSYVVTPSRTHIKQQIHQPIRSLLIRYITPIYPSTYPHTLSFTHTLFFLPNHSSFQMLNLSQHILLFNYYGCGFKYRYRWAREPWSSGNGKRIVFETSRVQIPRPDTLIVNFHIYLL